VLEQPQLDAKRTQALSIGLDKLVQKQAIVLSSKERTSFVSPIFVVPKAGGQWRLVISLKSLNQFVVTPYFKMGVNQISKGLGDWLTKLDLKGAYLTVPVYPCYQRYLKYNWQGQQWQFTVLPFLD